MNRGPWRDSTPEPGPDAEPADVRAYLDEITRAAADEIRAAADALRAVSEIPSTWYRAPRAATRNR